MGAQGSTIEGDANANHGSDSDASEEVVVQQTTQVVETATSVVVTKAKPAAQSKTPRSPPRTAPSAAATVVGRDLHDAARSITPQSAQSPTALPTGTVVDHVADLGNAAQTVPPRSTRPPTAPSTTTIVDRVIDLHGTIKHAYPLQTLAKDGAFGGGAFGVGSGPCGRDATQVVAWEVQIRDSYQTCYVFIYDKWAESVRDFQRHYKVDLTGLGLVAIDHWDIGHDTEDVKRCYVVAEPLLLKKAMERSPRLLPKPQGITIQIAYEEPQRVPDSDQVKYQPQQIIHARQLYGEVEIDEEGEEEKAKKKKQTALEPAVEKPNPRGKRTLRVMETDSAHAVAAAKITTPSSYLYTPLAELMPGNANLYGVVVNMSLPKRSDGRDYYMSLHLIDESTPKREDALQIMVFLPSLDQMPRVLHVGDIVRFHKIKVNRYQDRLQGVCHPRATRYLVLRRGGQGNPKVDQQTSSASWTFEKYDEERIHQLADWADHTLCVDTTLPPGCPQPSRFLGDMQYAESFADVVVRVLHVQQPYQDFTAARLIIWDGSGDASSCQDLYDKLRREGNRRGGGGEKAVPFVPESGLLMEVVVDSCWLVMETMGFLPKLTSHWCRFRNLAVSLEQSDARERQGSGDDNQQLVPIKSWYELHFREVSSVMLVPDTISEVQVRVQQVAGDKVEDNNNNNNNNNDSEIDKQDHPQQPETATDQPASVVRVATTVPAFILDKVPATKIQTVLTSTSVPRKYHCCARVVALWPSAIEQIAKLKPGTTSTYVYSFVMRLEDISGQIDVIVHGGDAETFLHGIPPCDLTTSTSSRGILEKRLSGLLAQTEPMHFCIKSYNKTASSSLTPTKTTPPGKKKAKTSAAEADAESSTAVVRYRLFDTILQVLP